MPSLATLNNLDDKDCAAALARCCGSSAWVQGMMARRPYSSTEAVMSAAAHVWQQLSKEDHLEAFAQHPQIGNVDSLRDKFADTAAWASGEQAGTEAASEALLRQLAVKNKAYLDTFGYIFIICASGQSAEAMLTALEARLENDADTEIRIAANEQAKITQLRLEKLLQEPT